MASDRLMEQAHTCATTEDLLEYLEALSDHSVEELRVRAVRSYTFENVRADHTIAASFLRRPAWNPFLDVASGDWFYDSVKYVYENDLMLGTGWTEFSPELSASRGMIVTILWRLEGSPAMSGSSFPDVAAGRFYTEAVAWASRNGIVNGYEDGGFHPEDAVTRQELAAILYRFAQHKGMDVSARDDLNGYTDAQNVSPYAQEPMRWAVGAGIITGKGGGILDPGGYATRAETAAMLMRFLNNA